MQTDQDLGGAKDDGAKTLKEITQNIENDGTLQKRDILRAGNAMEPAAALIATEAEHDSTMAGIGKAAVSVK